MECDGAFGRANEARCDIKNGRFPAAAGPHHRDEFAARHVQRYSLDGIDDPLARKKSFADVLEAEHWQALRAAADPGHPTAAMASISTISSGCERRRTSTVVLVGMAWL